MRCDMEPRERESPRKGNATGPDAEKRVFQEMSQAFQFLLCNPLEASAADTFWTELAGTPGVSYSSPGGFSLQRSQQTSRDQWENRSKIQVLILHLKPGTFTNCVCCFSRRPPHPATLEGRFRLSHLRPAASSPGPGTQTGQLLTHLPLFLLGTQPGHPSQPLLQLGIECGLG